MNTDKAIKIMHLVEGMDLEDGLATIGVALIHLCDFHHIPKQDMLGAMSAQWDLYQRQTRKRGPDERRKVN